MKNEIEIINKLQGQDWYENLVEECKAIIVERGFNSRIELIQGKWELGQRVSNENNNFERSKIYGKGIVEQISKDLAISTADIYFCIKFYTQFKANNFDEVLEQLPEGKNTSWNKITTKYLGNRSEKTVATKRKFKTQEILDTLYNLLKEYGDIDKDLFITRFRERLMNNEEKK